LSHATPLWRLARIAGLLFLGAGAVTAACDSKEKAAQPTQKLQAKQKAPALVQPNTKAVNGNGSDSMECFLRAHLQRYALKDLEDSWALAHALLVFPKETRLANGKTIPEQLMSLATWREQDGKRYPVFEGRSPQGTPREPHRDLILKSLMQAGVPLSATFSVAGQPATLRQLYEGAAWRFEVPGDGRYGADAWTLSAFSMGVGLGEPPSFVNHQAKKISISEQVLLALKDLEQEHAFLKQGQYEGAPLVKRRQGVFAEPCGAWHYLEALELWLSNPALHDALAPRLQALVELSSYRLRAEARLYDQTHERAPANLQRLLWIQELKFFGHYLEAMGIAEKQGLIVKRSDLEFARERLELAVSALRRLGAFDSMEAIRVERPQSYLDLIGDAAHSF